MTPEEEQQLLEQIPDPPSDSGRATARAEHQARDDAASCGMLPERNENKTGDSEAGKILYRFFQAIGFYPRKDPANKD